MHYILIVVLVVIDQLTKYFAKLHLSGGKKITLIPGLLGLNYLENTGAAFSLFNGWRTFLIVLPIIATLVLSYLCIKSFRVGKNILAYGYLLMISGAIGNLIDRIVSGGVIDFLEFKFIRFPIFNFADILVTSGVTLVCIYLIFFDKGGV